MSQPIDNLGWWSISGEAIMDMLNRAYNGELPSNIYAEYYANSEIEHHD